MLRVVGFIAAVLGLTWLAHWLQFKLLAIPLPRDRTSVWVIPFLTALAGSVLAVRPANLAQRIVRGSGVLALSICAALFVSSLRDSYFEEWRLFGADAKSAFPVLLEWSRRLGVREIPARGQDIPSLNFYRDLYGVTDLSFQQFDPPPRGRLLYVLPRDQDQAFIQAEGLQPVYEGPISHLQVLVRRQTAQ
jgi:hypothetical protein